MSSISLFGALSVRHRYRKARRSPPLTPAANTARKVSLLSFDLGAQEYALPLDRVREIIQLPEHVAEVAHSEAAIVGVVTLRDRLLPLVSLRSLLGLPPANGQTRGKVVVVPIGRGAIGVVTDRTREILHVDPDTIDPAPALLTRGEGDAEITAICRLERGSRLVALLSPDHLFRSDVVRRVLSEQSGEAGAEEAEDMETMADEQFIVFRLGDQEYGLPIASVDEIARPPERLARIPKAPAFVDGVMNLRGVVVPVIDLRKRFNIASAQSTGSQRILVLSLGAGKTGFVVDAVSEVAQHSRGSDRRGAGGVCRADAADRPHCQPRGAGPDDPSGRSGQPPRSHRSGCSCKVRPRCLRAGYEGFVIRLLIADDSALMRKLLEGIFREEGDFEIQLARNGTEALDLVRSFDPHVVTLDVQMPGLDGLSCLSRIMIEAPRPVVMISSLTADGAEATLEAIELGAVDFVEKPGGTVSLEIDRLRPLLVEKVRGAAKAKIRRTLRLAERVRHQFQQTGATRPAHARRVRKSAASARPSNGIVLIGASTGGPAALDIVLPLIPKTFGWPIVVAQHMPANFTAAFARRLNSICELDVVEASRPLPLLAGSIYIARGDADVVVTRRSTGLHAMPVPAKRDYPWHPSVERMVTSALEHYDPPQHHRRADDRHGARRSGCHAAGARARRPHDCRGGIERGCLGHARRTR